MFSLICVWINGWVNNREAGDLRRNCGHYDVNVMREKWKIEIFNKRLKTLIKWPRLNTLGRTLLNTLSHLSSNALNVAANVPIPWWRHQIETFSALLALYAGNSPVPGEFPAQRQWRGALMFSLICARINVWVNRGEAGDLSHHGAHYDVTVMLWTFADRYNDVKWVHWRLKAPATRLFRLTSKEPSKLRITIKSSDSQLLTMHGKGFRVFHKRKKFTCLCYRACLRIVENANIFLGSSKQSNAERVR